MRLAALIANSLFVTGYAFAGENAGPVPMGVQPYPVSTGRPHVCFDLYPSSEKANHIEGDTELRFTVTMDGTVKDVIVAKSSGNSALDDAAITCALRWRYKPLPMDVSSRASVYWRAPH